MKYKSNEVVEAEQFDGSDEMVKKYLLYYIPQINSFMGNGDIKGTLMIGDWIVKHEDGSTEVMSNGEFEKKYTFYKPQEKQFRVELLPNLYLLVIIENGKEHLEISGKGKNDDFSDLGGPEFIQSFYRSYYQGLQKEYSEYLPKFDPNDKRFIFEENNK